MFKIGRHMSVSNGFAGLAANSLELKTNSFQFFTRNPRGGKIKKVDNHDVLKMLEIMTSHKFAKIVAHAPYTFNPCSTNESVREFTTRIFKEDLEIMELMPNNYYNFHPGSHTGQGVEAGINQICDMLNKTLTKEQTTTVLLETMAGKGSEIGGNFKELSTIIKNVNFDQKLGVCLDTCHVFDAGYDIAGNLERVLEEFDKTIGIEKLKVVHLNDSKNTLGSKKDRHENIGKGTIGLDAISQIINHKQLENLEFILETPSYKTLEETTNEINLLKELKS